MEFLGAGCYPKAQSQFGLHFLSIQASSGARGRADPSQSCGQGRSHGAVLGLGLWGLVEDVGPPLPPQPPSFSTASPVPPWPLDAQGGPWAPRAPTFPSQWTPPLSRPSDSLLPWPTATPCLLAGGRLKVVPKPRGLECEGRSAARVWSSSRSSRSNRGQPGIAPPGTCCSPGESGPPLSLSLDLLFFHPHEEGSDLRAQDKSHPLAGRRPRVQGSGKPPTPTSSHCTSLIQA